MPAVKTYDDSYRQELGEQTAYERWALNKYRSRLFRQSESPNGVTEFTLGDVTEKGELLGHTKLEMTSHLSESAVMEALEPFRVLAFTDAFKLLDMIAEWVLVANCENHRDLRRFSQKLAKYEQFKEAGSLHEPPELQRNPPISRAFWALYERLEPPRGAVVHTGKLQVEPSGTIEIEDRNGAVTRLDVEAQGALIRFACLLSGMLVGDPKPTSFHEAVIEKTLELLAPFHGVGFRSRPIRFEAVRLNVPALLAKQARPYACEVDWAAIREWMDRSSPTGPGGELFLAVEIVADAVNRELVWQLPPEAVPRNGLELREDDPALRAHLEVRRKAPGLGSATAPDPV